MGSSRRLILRWNWQRRLISLAVIVSVCAAIFPLPISWPSTSAKDLSQPFPCQNRPCGCRSADQCWKKCCCFTNSQKVAWAKARQVRVPEFVIAAARTESGLAQQNGTSCCPKSSCKIDPRATPPAAESTAAAEESKVVYVIAALAHQCQGQPWLWSTLPWAVLSDTSDCPIFISQSGAKLGITSASSVTHTERPPIPPPRCLSTVASAI